MAYTFADDEVATATNLNSWRAPAAFRSGVVRITPTAGTPTSVQVTFPSSMPAFPRVLVTPVTIYPGSVVKGAMVTNVSQTGFTLWLTRSTGTTTSVNWVAFCPTNTFTTSSPAWASLLNVTAEAPVVKTGLVTITPSGSDVETSQVVTFGSSFSTTPVVVLSPNSAVVGTVVNGWSVTEVGSGGFKAWVRRSSTTATGLYWFAVGN